MKKLFEEARKMKSPIQPDDYGKILKQSSLNSTVQSWSEFLPSINKLMILSASVITSILLFGLYFYYQSGNISEHSAGGSQSTPVVDQEIPMIDPDTKLKDQENISGTEELSSSGHYPDTFVSSKSEQQTSDEPVAKSDFTQETGPSQADTGSQKLRVRIHNDGQNHDSLLLNAGKIMIDAIDKPMKVLEQLSGFAGAFPDSTKFHLEFPEKFIAEYETEFPEDHKQLIKEHEDKIDESRNPIEAFRNKMESADIESGNRR